MTASCLRKHGRLRLSGGFWEAHHERAQARGSPRVRVRDPAAARRAAARSEHRRPRGADLPDHQLRVRGPGVGGGVLQPAGVREHVLAHHEPDRGGVRGARGQPRGRERRRGVRQRDRGAGGRALHAAAAGRPRRLLRGAVRRDGEPVQAPAPEDERGADLGRSGLSPTPGRPRSARTRRPSSPRRSATRPGTCWTSRPWRPSRTPATCR